MYLGPKTSQRFASLPSGGPDQAMRAYGFKGSGFRDYKNLRFIRILEFGEVKSSGFFWGF